MQTRTRLFFSAFITVLGFAAASNASALERLYIYLHIPGVMGTVKTKGFEGDIEITSYSQSLQNNGTGARPTCGPTQLTKNVDVSSQFFSRSVLEQSAPFTADILFVDPVTLMPSTIISMRSAKVVAITDAGSESAGQLTENLMLESSNISVSYINGTARESYTASCPLNP